MDENNKILSHGMKNLIWILFPDPDKIRNWIPFQDPDKNHNKSRDQQEVAGRRPCIVAGGVQAGFALDASKLDWPWTQLRFIPSTFLFVLFWYLQTAFLGKR